MAFKSRSTFITHCKNIHKNDVDEEFPPHKVSCSFVVVLFPSLCSQVLTINFRTAASVTDDIQVSDVRHGFPQIPTAAGPSNAALPRHKKGQFIHKKTSMQSRTGRGDVVFIAETKE